MTAILWLLGGAAIGAGVGLAIYILGFCVELINCACHIISCNCDFGNAIPSMWESESFLMVLIFCSICGAIIGFIYGLFKMKSINDAKIAKQNAEISEAARIQRVQWAAEIKQKSLTVSDTCESNHKSFSPLVSTTYTASAEMEKIMKEFAKVAELKGKVDVVANDFKKKGGTSE